MWGCDGALTVLCLLQNGRCTTEVNSLKVYKLAATMCMLCSAPVIAERAASAAASRFPISPCTSCAPRLRAHTLFMHFFIVLSFIIQGTDDPERAWRPSLLSFLLLDTSLTVSGCTVA